MQEVIVFPFFETIEESDEQLLSSLLNTWYEEGDLFPKEFCCHWFLLIWNYWKRVFVREPIKRYIL